VSDADPVLVNRGDLPDVASRAFDLDGVPIGQASPGDGQLRIGDVSRDVHELHLHLVARDTGSDLTDREECRAGSRSTTDAGASRATSQTISNVDFRDSATRSSLARCSWSEALCRAR
jgi:hypothetical protein